MKIQRLVHLFILFCIAPLSAADTITGMFGYELGSSFIADNAKLINREKSSASYLVVPKNKHPRFNHYTISINEKKIIYQISASGAATDSEQCYAHAAQLVAELSARHPGIGSYALDDSDMLYMDERVITIGCASNGDKKSLRLVITDDRLAR